MPSHEVTTFCRICEPLCGLIATVEDGRLVKVRGDSEHALSEGFMCTKAAAMIEVTYDRDRVRTPLKRVGAAGEFVAVSWNEALDDISSRLKSIISRDGPEAYAMYWGNPPGFGIGSLLGIGGFQAMIGSPWVYGVLGEDGAAHGVALKLVYPPGASPIPDIWETDFVLLIGSNPYVSHGSGFSEPQARKALKGIVERGGRVVVIDPRRTETAQHFEHVFLRPGTDPWLLGGMLNWIIVNGLADEGFIARYTEGDALLRTALKAFDVETSSAMTGVPAATIIELARGFASAKTAAIWGRTGSCTQRFGTLANIFQELLVIVTANLDRPGGMRMGWGAVSIASAFPAGSASATRVNGYPAAFGSLPSQGLAADISTPGVGQIRALMTVGANPVHNSGAGGAALEQALSDLELHFSLDLYVNETNRWADYVLPTTGFFEREDFPFIMQYLMLRPTLFATDRVIEPVGEAREEWVILNQIARKMGRGGAYATRRLRWRARLGFPKRPRQIIDHLLRTSEVGDHLGFKGSGLSWKMLIKRYPHGVRIREGLPTGNYLARLDSTGEKIRLAPSAMLDEIARLVQHDDDASYPMRLIGMRETRSHNSWMHNAPRLMPSGRTPTALVNPIDAQRLGLTDPDGEVRITSRTGEIVSAARISDEVMPGTVAMPHGWRHNGGWQLANAAGGAWSNALTSSDPADVEALAGMSILNGIPIRLTLASPTRGNQEGIDN